MSLQRLILRDFVIVQELDLDLLPGFTVLTGETGAGKSILIDALQCALGARADVLWVREGAARCEVAAEFAALGPVQAWLLDNGFDCAADEPLLLRRQIDTQGRSRAWINSGAATMGQLKALAELLVDIHGQHAWQGLTRPDATRALLDAYARIDCGAQRQAWRDWQTARQALVEAEQGAADHLARLERLNWELQELDQLAPLPQEWDTLNQQQGRLAHAQGVMEAAQTALQALDDDSNGVGAGLLAATQALQAQARHEPDYLNVLRVLEDVHSQVRDCAHGLQRHAHRDASDPEALAALDQRIAQWLTLARRLHVAPEDLPQRREASRATQKALQLGLDTEALAQQAAAAQSAWQVQADKVRAQRQQGAIALAKAITQAMQGLGMQGGRFEVALLPLPQPQSSGLDAVEFRVAAHPGSTPAPVGKVASGGELSRIALAIAVTTSQLGETPTLIFDEVDAGIGGAVAQTVGRLLHTLGRDRQVLAVTHLPQVAACADQHLVVSKTRDPAGTRSQVQPVAREGRVTELARMLGGEPLSDAALSHAREMLQP